MIVSRLAVFVDVKPFFFYALVYAEPDGRVYYLEQDEGNDRAEHDRYHGCYNLNPKLVPVAVESALNAVFARDEAGSEYTGQDRTDDTAYAVYAERIECIVILEFLRRTHRVHRHT